jgi:hypothetical protein
MNANPLMLTPMSATDSDRIRELKMTAKWSTDGDEKKGAISELLQYGDKGILAIQEVLSVTAYDDVKQACIEAIRSIGRGQKNTEATPKTRRKSASKKKKQKRSNK